MWSFQWSRALCVLGLPSVNPGGAPFPPLGPRRWMLSHLQLVRGTQLSRCLAYEIQNFQYFSCCISFIIFEFIKPFLFTNEPENLNDSSGEWVWRDGLLPMSWPLSSRLCQDLGFLSRCWGASLASAKILVTSPPRLVVEILESWPKATWCQENGGWRNMVIPQNSGIIVLKMLERVCFYLLMPLWWIPCMYNCITIPLNFEHFKIRH